MTQQVIPLSATSNQTLNVTLGGQSCQITVDTKLDIGVFVSLWVDASPIVLSSLARDRVGLVRYAYTGFKGELFFADTQGTNDPDFTGFGSRYLLVYDSEATLK